MNLARHISRAVADWAGPFGGSFRDSWERTKETAKGSR